MKILLDTHTFIWWDTDPQQPSSRALALCRSPENQLLLSVVSVWEMVIKIQIGKLHFAKPLAEMITGQQQTNQINLLPVSFAHVLAVESLPLHHKDPFDRLLVAQARVENMVILSRDAQLRNYAVQVEWAETNDNDTAVASNK